MYVNPLQYLTERQLKLLAQAEGLSVSQLLAKYERLQVKRSRAKKAASKRRASTRGVSRGSTRLNPSQRAGLAKGQSLMAEAAEAYRAGRYDSMPEALRAVAAKRRR